MKPSFHVLVICALNLTTPAFGAADTTGSPSDLPNETERVFRMPNASFFENCAFVSVDFQQGGKSRVTDIPDLWKRLGYTVEDCNAASDFGHDVGLPNAVRIADACRSLRLPMIFIHWGCRFDDGMDLEPEVRRMLLEERARKGISNGPLGERNARPADAFAIREGEYVIPKSGQDAFPSSCLEYVLRNLGVKRIVFVGGHTNPGGCLGRTARSAKRLGFETLCVEDATYDAGESTRKPGIAQAGFDYVVTTEEFLSVVDKAHTAPESIEAQSQK